MAQPCTMTQIPDDDGKSGVISKIVDSRRQRTEAKMGGKV
jgi:hypothetical protein